MQNKRQSQKDYKLKILSEIENISLIDDSIMGGINNVQIEISVDSNDYILEICWNNNAEWSLSQSVYFDTLIEIQKLFPKVNILKYKNFLENERKEIIAKFVAEEI